MVHYMARPGGLIVRTNNILEWGSWFEDNSRKPFLEGGRRVGWTALEGHDSFVSTVFLGMDHNFSGEGPPILFETMVCREGEWGECWRDMSYEAALSTHQQVVRFAKGEITEEEVQ